MTRKTNCPLELFRCNEPSRNMKVAPAKAVNKCSKISAKWHQISSRSMLSFSDPDPEAVDSVVFRPQAYSQTFDGSRSHDERNSCDRRSEGPHFSVSSKRAVAFKFFYKTFYNSEWIRSESLKLPALGLQEPCSFHTQVMKAFQAKKSFKKRFRETFVATENCHPEFKPRWHFNVMCCHPACQLLLYGF